MDHLLNDHIKQAYEQQLEYAIRAWELMPPIVIAPPTRKQKIKRAINHRKRMLGKFLYKISNGLGYYDDTY